MSYKPCIIIICSGKVVKTIYNMGGACTDVLLNVEVTIATVSHQVKSYNCNFKTDSCVFSL